MSYAQMTASNLFTTPARQRLGDFLRRSNDAETADNIHPLTPDASTREYFRISWHDRSAIACVYPEPFDPAFHPYLDVTRLFAGALLPVPEVLAVDGNLGVIVQEDLGDRQLRAVLQDSARDEGEALLEQAIRLLADVQAATTQADEAGSIASKLAFDEAKLDWELSFFREHYFGSYRGETLSHGEAAELKVELNDLAAELSARPRVLCHRDYHTSNIMVDRAGKLRIIDHQDARMGPASYDLVSLLLDRRLELPSLAQVRAYRLLFLNARVDRGLERLDPDDFAHEFRLMAVQRCLKATGTFSYQTAVAGRIEYEQFINPTLKIVEQAAEWLERFPVLRRMITERI
jgi:aminoglycoside/choline kinase family phosphotransferase